MQHMALVLFIISLVIHSLASSLPEILCSDGKPGITVQLAPARLHPFQPATYSTDCSRIPPLLHKRYPIIDKRQENGCSADAPARCNNDSPQRPSSSDCSKLLDDLNRSASQFVVQGFQTVTREYNTCRLSLQNIVSSSFIYCETSWAIRSSSVINECFSGNNGGFAQGSRFSAIVGYNPNYQAPAPSSAQPSVNPPASQPTTTSNNGGSNNGGSNNSGGNSSNAGSSAQTNAGGGTNANPTGSAGSNGATSGATRADGSNTNSNSNTSGGVLVTSVLVSGSTTLPGGSVVAATITLSSISVPGFGASFPADSANSNGGGPDGKRAPYLIPVIVGCILGALAILILLLFCLWRRKKRARLQKEAEQGQQEMEEDVQMPYNISHTLGVQQYQNLGVAEGEGGSQESIAALAKAQMAAEEARSRHGHNPSMENASSITGDSVFSPSDSATPPYRSRSQHHRRGRGGADSGRSPSPSSSNGQHLHRHWRGAFGSGTIGTETASSLLTRSTSGSESSRRHQSSRRHHSQRRRRGDGDSIDSGSISARTLAQTAAPNLSEVDIDRLAESIVARIHGRDPALAEQARYGHGARTAPSVLSEGEDEPPPPWSAPERNSRQSLQGL